MPILTILWKYKHWIAIAVFFFLWVGQIAYTNHLSGKLRKAGNECTAKIQKIEQKHIKTLTEKQNQINQASAEYEQVKAEQRTKVETVTRTVQKIVERPIYLNRCIDDDGLSEINSLIKTSDARESTAALSDFESD